MKGEVTLNRFDDVLKFGELIEMSNYGFGKKVDLGLDAAIERVTEELAKEGFGILTVIDVQATLKMKLDKDPLHRLKLLALTGLSPAERKEILEKLVLLRTGKLTAAERKELFEKLRITAEYYKKNKKRIESELTSKTTAKKKEIKRKLQKK